MLPEWISPLVAKAKVAGLLGAALAAGGIGGTVALTHVTPAAHQTVQQTAADTGTDPETTDAGTTEASDPETSDAQDPETTDAQTPAPCPSDVKNHGAYVSSVARSAPHGKGADHGAIVSAAAKSDCGKPAKDSAGGDSTDPESSDAGSDSTDPESGDASGDTGTHGSTHGGAGSTHSPAAGQHGQGHSKH
jgi:hypothetical protein